MPRPRSTSLSPLQARIVNAIRALPGSTSAELIPRVYPGRPGDADGPPASAVETISSSLRSIDRKRIASPGAGFPWIVWKAGKGKAFQLYVED